jgi:hypothetical protein
VPQDGLRVPRWHAEVFEQRPDRVTKAMDLDDPDLVVVADAAERPDQVPRLDRPPGASGEHQAEVGPGAAHVSAVGVLALGLELERLVDDAERCPALDWVGWTFRISARRSVR